MKQNWLEWMERKNEWIHRIKWNANLIKKEKKYRMVLNGVALIAAVAVFTLIGIKESQAGQLTMQQDIASEIIRFHVIANSDSDEDQAVKLKVKDAVVTALQKKMSHTETIEEAREELSSNLDWVSEIADTTLREYGYEYGAKAELCRQTFPIKVYGDITLPAGEYEALCIRLGQAKGQNWWCIVFPALCYVNETYSYVPDDSKERLKHVLAEDEYDQITKGEGVHIKVKFKLWDKIKKYF